MQMGEKRITNRTAASAADGYLAAIGEKKLFTGEGIHIVHIYQIAGVALNEPSVQLRLEVGKPPVNIDFLVLGNDPYLAKLLFKEQDVL